MKWYVWIENETGRVQLVGKGKARRERTRIENRQHVHDSPSKIGRYDSLYIVLHQWWLWWKFIRPNTCEYVLSWPHWDFFRHTRRYVIDFSFRTVRMSPVYPSQVCEIWVDVSTKNGSQGSSAVTMTIRKQTIVQLFFCLGSIHASSSKHFFHVTYVCRSARRCDENSKHPMTPSMLMRNPSSWAIIM